MNVNHSIITKMFEEEMESPLKGKMEKQPTKIEQIHLAIQLSYFLSSNILSRKVICSKNCFLRIWACWLLKIIYPCNLWKFCGGSTYACKRLVFPSRKLFSQQMFLELMEKTKQLYVLLVWSNVILQHWTLIFGCQKCSWHINPCD